MLLTQRHVEQQSREQLNELIESMSSMASIACFAKDATLAKETAEAFTTHSTVHRLSIIAYGKLLAKEQRQQDTVTPSQSIDKPAITHPLYSPFDANEKIGEIVLEPNWHAIQHKIDTSVREVAWMLISLALGIVGVIAAVVTFIVVRPVKALSDRLHSLDAHSPKTLQTPRGHDADELGRLVGDINSLIARFKTSLKKEHELHLQKVLNEKLRLYAAMFEHSQEGITITDRQNHIVAVNQAFTQITGYPENEVLGKNPNLLFSGRHDRKFYETMWHDLLTTGHWKGELWNRCKNGDIKPKWFSISVVRDDDDEIVNHIAIFSDISERKMAEERIEFLAHHDFLTKLPNRVLTRDRFAQAQAASARDKNSIAMLYIDLDNFKYDNDTFGHQAGDQLLLSVVDRLKKQVRETDTISRQGGDEFMIILPGIKDWHVVDRITANILDSLTEPFNIAGHAIGISASVGIAGYPQHGTDFDLLLKNADAAMYAAKHSGKNASRLFSEEMNVDALDKLKLKAHLGNAFQNNEFRLVFQPQINITSGRLIGAEVLCRWIHPELGAISPARFIPLAEESGLIGPLGEWVLTQACQQGKRWLDSGIPPFVIAVNVSAQQFNHGDLHATVGQILDASGFPPEYLELEFTESGLLNNIEHSVITIERLKTLGVKLSIDDFGTGYSSLSYLKQFKVEKLKIDQSFVRDIENDADDLGIIRAIIQLGKTLQLDVIAEGVETEKQKHILQSLECHEAQGYLISKPLPPREFEEFIAQWNADRSKKA